MTAQRNSGHVFDPRIKQRGDWKPCVRCGLKTRWVSTGVRDGQRMEIMEDGVVREHTGRLTVCQKRNTP